MSEVSLEAWAKERGLRPRVLIAAARRGGFPPIVRLSQRVHLVDSDAIEQWRTRNTIGVAVGGVAAALDDRPLEPFADRPDEEAGAAPTVEPARRRRCAANAGARVSRRRGARK